METPIVLSEVQKSLSSHAIADYLLMDNFVEAVAVGQYSISINFLFIQVGFGSKSFVLQSKSSRHTKDFFLIFILIYSHKYK